MMVQNHDKHDCRDMIIKGTSFFIVKTMNSHGDSRVVNDSQATIDDS